ncbi:MAG TPA: twin-arginine translocation signal domain-containing protein, partial [Gemmatimonadaceae bacterium]|nr:twin-arginine translocation signal domain-containing protein [Gemmatimonadaceae bacterium]
MGIDRRRFLAASGGALGALVLAACDSMGPKSAKPLLELAERTNERLERALLSHRSMDVPRNDASPTGQRFPSYFISDSVPVWDEATRGLWRLEVGGMVNKPLSLSLADLASLSR